MWGSGKYIIVVAGLLLTTPAMASGEKGMTWGFVKKDFPSSTNPFRKRVVYLACKGCGSRHGDTSCSVKRRVLCVKTTGSQKKRPPYPVATRNAAMPSEFYDGWVSRPVKLSPKIKGDLLTSRAVADNFCGSGWRMAEFHDGRWIAGMSDTQHYGGSGSPSPWIQSSSRSGGWGLHAKYNGGMGKLNKRFWVAINDQPANCWD